MEQMEKLRGLLPDRIEHNRGLLRMWEMVGFCPSRREKRL